MSCPLLAGGRPLPTLDIKPPEGRSSKSRDPPREEERERKKKKHRKRPRTRSRSPKRHSPPKPRSRSRSTAKHCLPSAYRTARRSRWVCRAPPRPRIWCGCRPPHLLTSRAGWGLPRPAPREHRPTPACVDARCALPTQIRSFQDIFLT